MTDQKDMLADLRKLVGERLTETVEGKVIVLAPFEFQRLPKMVELIEQAKDVIVVVGDALDINAMKLLAEQYDVALQLMVEMSGQDEAWLRGLPADSALFLLSAYIRVNADFFIQRLAPLVMLALTSLAPSASPSASRSTPGPPTTGDGATSLPN